VPLSAHVVGGLGRPHSRAGYDGSAGCGRSNEAKEAGHKPHGGASEKSHFGHLQDAALNLKAP
jgi:hypothetical protein